MKLVQGNPGYFAIWYSFPFEQMFVFYTSLKYNHRGYVQRHMTL